MGGTIYITGAVADGSITSAKIANSAVTNGKLSNSSVSATKLTTNAVITDKIADDAVTNAKLADNSVNSNNYVDGSINTAHIADANVTAAKLASGVQTTINNNAVERVITGSNTPNTLNANASLHLSSGGLHIEDSSSPFVHLKDNTNNTDAYIQTNDQGSVVIKADDNGESANSKIHFQIDGSEKACIDSTGQVGIGTTSPSTTLSVINDDNNQGINVKHSNLTKGVNVGFEKIQTVGSASDVSLTIQAKGPSANLRCGIDSYNVFGAQQDSRDFRIFKNKNGWSTLQMDADGGITGPLRRHVRRMNNGQNSVATINVFRLRRHNWGSGFFEVRMYATYYSGSYLRRFRINGHGAGGNYYSVQTMDDNFTNGGGADWSVGCQIANASNSAPGDNTTYFCDVQVTIPNYWYGLCELVMSSGYQTNNASAGTSMSSNSYTLWS